MGRPTKVAVFLIKSTHVSQALLIHPTFMGTFHVQNKSNFLILKYIHQQELL